MAAAEYTFTEVYEGQQAQFEVTITQSLVSSFAELSGDQNPLHTSEEYAAQTRFKSPVAHGMLAGAFFSRLVGMYLPGASSLYLSQSLFFRKPMRMGMGVRVEGEILHKTESQKTLVLKTRVVDKSSGDVLTEGEAVVHMLV